MSGVNVMEFDTCNGVHVVGNTFDAATKRIDAATSCTDVRIQTNYATFIAAAAPAGEGVGDLNEVNPVVTVGSVTPVRLHQTTIVSGEHYVATGTGATTDWQQTTP
jgi:hypothetical protein